jgi:uncharacterized protein (TIGR02246 family)
MTASAAVVELLHRYAHAVDDADAAAVAACFTGDGRFRTRDGTVDVRGRAALRDFFAGSLSAPGVVTTHLMGNAVVTLAAGGDTATTQLDAVVYRRTAAASTVTVRGLRYRDRAVRRSDGRWLLAEREHELRWET